MAKIRHQQIDTGPTQRTVRNTHNKIITRGCLLRVKFPHGTGVFCRQRNELLPPKRPFFVDNYTVFYMDRFLLLIVRALHCSIQATICRRQKQPLVGCICLASLPITTLPPSWSREEYLRVKVFSFVIFT